jgi:uncharacterized membrane protein
MQGITESDCRRILGQVMDVTYLTWILSYFWVEQVRFAQFFPPTHLYSTFVTPTFGSVMLVQGGDILGIYGIIDLWVMGRRFLMWGH